MMKHFIRKIVTATAALAIACIPVLTTVRHSAQPTLTADAASFFTTTPTGYTKATDVKYVTVSGYTVNWGARGEDCTFLSSKALSFYTGNNTYEVFSQTSGGTTQSNAKDSALYSTLKSFMTSKHKTQTSYAGTRDLYKYTDCVSNGYNQSVSSFYSGTKIGPSWDSGKTWNREHTWPNSKGLGGNDENDIMMLRPTWVQENSSRGNTAYGQSSKYFDPNCEGANVRGDCARIVLYVYTRWGNTNSMWGESGVMENMNVLLQWMQEDPVDTWEMGRNDAVQSITGTRNVFVDYPELAFKLFGKSVPANMTTPSGGVGSGGGSVTPDIPDVPDTPDTPDSPELPAANSQVSIAKALEIGSSMAHNTTTNDKYYVTGKITEVKDSYYGNMTIQDENGDSIFVYGTFDEDGQKRYGELNYPPSVTNTVTLYTVIGNFNGPQLKNAWMIGVSTDLPTPPDTPDVPDTPDTPDSPSGNVLATFTFGDNKSAAHNDGVNKTAKTYTENDYTLNITGGTQLYVDANDAKGNSCLKLGSSKNVGSFSFTVPSDVTSVVFEIAKYKANNSAVKINGTVCTPTVNSNDGQYDSFTVDTSSAKTVSVETVSGTTRVMINSITFLGASEPIVPDEPDTPITPDEPDTPITPDEPDTPITPDASDSGSIGDSTNGTVGGSTSDVISGLIEAGCAATLGSSAILALLPVAVFLYKKKEH